MAITVSYQPQLAPLADIARQAGAYQRSQVDFNQNLQLAQFDQRERMQDDQQAFAFQQQQYGALVNRENLNAQLQQRSEQFYEGIRSRENQQFTGILANQQQAQFDRQTRERSQIYGRQSSERSQIYQRQGQQQMAQFQSDQRYGQMEYGGQLQQERDARLQANEMAQEKIRGESRTAEALYNYQSKSRASSDANWQNTSENMRENLNQAGKDKVTRLGIERNMIEDKLASGEYQQEQYGAAMSEWRTRQGKFLGEMDAYRKPQMPKVIRQPVEGGKGYINVDQNTGQQVEVETPTKYEESLDFQPRLVPIGDSGDFGYIGPDNKFVNDSALRRQEALDQQKVENDYRIKQRESFFKEYDNARNAIDRSGGLDSSIDPPTDKQIRAEMKRREQSFMNSTNTQGDFSSQQANPSGGMQQDQQGRYILELSSMNEDFVLIPDGATYWNPLSSEFVQKRSVSSNPVEDAMGGL